MDAAPVEQAGRFLLVMGPMVAGAELRMERVGSPAAVGRAESLDMERDTHFLSFVVDR